MAIEVILPKQGQTVETCNLLRWFKKEGEEVKKGEPLYEIETDKASFEVEANASGILRHVLYPEGTEGIPVLSVLAVIAQPGEEVPRPEAGKIAEQPAPAAKTEVAVSSTQASTGEKPAPETKVPASPSLHQRPDGRAKLFITPRARQLAASEGLTTLDDLVQIPGSGPQGRIREGDVRAFLAAQPTPAAVNASPVAQRLAAEAGIDLSTVVGTGPGGRITKEDVQRALATPPAAPVTPSPKPTAPIPTGLTGIRKIIAERMRANLDTAAHVTVTTEADATELVELRTALVADLEREGIRPAYNDLLIKIVARVLAEQPNVNVSLTDRGIVQHSAIHIGLAVDTERGLLVPVVRDADQKGVAQIAQETRRLAEKARAGQLLPDEMSGGTFTITNLGMYEIDAFTPIINVPESAILGVGRILPRPWVYNGEVAVRQIVFLSLSFDHRIVDGAPAARFLQRVKHLIEKPHLMWA